MSKTRIAVAGAGYIGQAHMDAAQASGTVALSAIVDPSPAAVPLAAAAGVPLFRSLEELLATDRPHWPDGVVLATPNQLHVPHARVCMQAGLPMLLEKPLAPTLAEGEALVAEATQRGARILVGHHRAHSPIMAKARDVMQSGVLGRLVAVMGSARQAILPDVPTFAELGLAGFEDLPYYGIFAPTGTPQATIDKISAALAKVVALPEVHERLTAMGLSVAYMTPQQLTTRERAYSQTWARIIQSTGFVAQ